MDIYLISKILQIIARIKQRKKFKIKQYLVFEKFSKKLV